MYIYIHLNLILCCTPETNIILLVSFKKKTCLPVQETLETPVGSVGWEDPLEKEITTYSSVLAWRIFMTGEPDGLQSTGSDTTEAT